MMAKNVLVSLGNNTRVVAFQSGGDRVDDLSSLSDAIKGIFRMFFSLDRLSSSKLLLLSGEGCLLILETACQLIRRSLL